MTGNNFLKKNRLKTEKYTTNFWKTRFDLNANTALLYQWDKYEELGTIDNFRIAAGKKNGNRKGFFYTDSDLHKWADAACRVIAHRKSPGLEKRINTYISIVKEAQEVDGYINTFNQIHFPGIRWKNLQIEHELYCMGHFIEAGVEHFTATGSRTLLELSIKTADLICSVFKYGGPAKTPGHQEIELALIKLYRVTSGKEYLDTAEHFIEIRGRMHLPGINLLKEFISHTSRMKEVNRQLDINRSGAGFDFTENLQRVEPPFIRMRAFFSFFSGKYQQQHKPVRKQITPAGHAVRWAYQSIAAAMLLRERNDDKLLAVQEKLWNRLVSQFMYVTGGTGSLPVIEGFGRPWELNSGFAYCETCAAIGNIFWNYELLSATGDVKYAEMMEWLIYNAASVGIALDGKSYFYRNPLSSEGGLARRPWFATACCPSNISRLWGSLENFAVRVSEQEIFIDQYISGTTEIESRKTNITIESAFPWKGDCSVKIINRNNSGLKVNFRVPGWSGMTEIQEVKKDPLIIDGKIYSGLFGPQLFSHGRYHSITIPAKKEVVIKLYFMMEIRSLSIHRKAVQGKNCAALSRGPLVYCAESTDNVPDILFSNNPVTGPEKYSFHNDLLKGTGTITAQTSAGDELILIPYYAWGNRGASSMRVIFPYR